MRIFFWLCPQMPSTYYSRTTCLTTRKVDSNCIPCLVLHNKYIIFNIITFLFGWFVVEHMNVTLLSFSTCTHTRWLPLFFYLKDDAQNIKMGNFYFFRSLMNAISMNCHTHTTLWHPHLGTKSLQ